MLTLLLSKHSRPVCATHGLLLTLNLNAVRFLPQTWTLLYPACWQILAPLLSSNPAKNINSNVTLMLILAINDKHPIKRDFDNSADLDQMCIIQHLIRVNMQGFH